MKPLESFTDDDWGRCHWRGVRETFRHIATSGEKSESQRVVKPLHWYVACRLVLEGGFLPEEITPHPPFHARQTRKGWLLSFDSDLASGSEATVLGGLKTKRVDVVVEKRGIGPVIAISCKTVGNAFRNLTNRMEEAVGECTNLHMTYTALVTGYFTVLRGHRAGSDANLKPNDVAILENGQPVDGIDRYHEALRNLQGREDLRDTISKYEAVALSLVETLGPNAGQTINTFPPSQSPLRAERFFETVYRRYDERFVFAAPTFVKRNLTPRVEWSSASALFDTGTLESIAGIPELDYDMRLVCTD